MLRLRTAAASKVVPGGPEGTTDNNDMKHHRGGMDRDRGQKKEAAWRDDNEGSGKLIGGAIVSCGCWAGGRGLGEMTRGEEGECRSEKTEAGTGEGAGNGPEYLEAFLRYS